MEFSIHFNGDRYTAPYNGGELDIQKLLGNFPGIPGGRYAGEKHLPGHNFTGYRLA